MAVGQHVHSDSKTGKVVMKEMPGKLLAHIIGDVKNHGERRRKWKNGSPKSPWLQHILLRPRAFYMGKFLPLFFFFQ